MEYLKSPPLAFAGMKQILEAKGNSVTVIDAYGHYLSVKQAAQQVLASQPDVVGFGGFGMPKTLEFNQGLLSRIRDSKPGIVTIVGGPVTARSAPRELALEALHPDIAVIGEGELAMAQIAASNFSASQLAASSDPAKFAFSESNGTVIFQAKERYSMDKTNHIRPEEWLEYYSGDVDWQRGCIGANNCKFCAGFVAAPSYKSPEPAVEELIYLRRMGRSATHTIGPDFTATPRKANAILEEIIRKGINDWSFFTEVRLDTFLLALRENSDIWIKLAEKNTVAPLVGYESAVPESLMFMGKMTDETRAKAYLIDLLDLLDKNYPFQMWLNWMLIRPGSTLEQVGFDLLLMIAMLKKYMDRLFMNHYIIYNNMSIFPGMDFYDKDGIAANWHESIHPALKNLYDYMEKKKLDSRELSRKLLLGKLGMRMLHWRMKRATGRFSPDSFGVKLQKKAVIFQLQDLVQLFCESMDETTLTQCKKDILALADRFEDHRVKELIQGEI